MVLYETGSRYERFLLSGYGASHYDAARELPTGDFQLVWVGRGNDVEDTSFRTMHSPLQRMNHTTSDELHLRAGSRQQGSDA